MHLVFGPLVRMKDYLAPIYGMVPCVMDGTGAGGSSRVELNSGLSSTAALRGSSFLAKVFTDVIFP